MVVFVDLEHDAFNKQSYTSGHDALFHPYLEPSNPPSLTKSKLMSIGNDAPPSSTSGPASVSPVEVDPSADPTRDTTTTTTHPPEAEAGAPNRSAFSAALSCYPIIKEIARAVDLNTLHALARTCRQFHANLSPYRQQLVKQTLRCENEYIETLSDLLQGGAAIPDSVKSVMRLLSQGAANSRRYTSGKVGKCARDMVAECRRCSKVVCRNCTAKPATGNALKNRIRRLCSTCRQAPLSDLISPPSSSSPSPSTPAPTPSSSFTLPAFQRTPCTCTDSAWLCHQCGQQLRSSDTTYRRVWTWRTRYSTYLGGLGTGIGEGCQGVKCGRGEDCLAAKEIELEVECESDNDSLASNGNTPDHPHHHHHHPHGNQLLDAREEDTGYFRQEIIGIGGRVKQKAKKRVLVGACVVEYEDERESGRYLTREEDGRHRSWCGWCWRVIPTKGDLEGVQDD